MNETIEENSDLKECRICKDDSEEETLLNPCVCKGTIKLVHMKCLSQWMQTTKEEFCRICRTKFKVKYRKIGHNFYKFLMSDEKHRIPFLLNIMFTAIIVFIAILSKKYIESIGNEYDKHFFKFCLSISSLIVINVCIVLLLIQSWIHFFNHFKNWRKRHFDIVLET